MSNWSKYQAMLQLLLGKSEDSMLQIQNSTTRLGELRGLQFPALPAPDPSAQPLARLLSLSAQIASRLKAIAAKYQAQPNCRPAPPVPGETVFIPTPARDDSNEEKLRAKFELVLDTFVKRFQPELASIEKSVYSLIGKFGLDPPSALPRQEGTGARAVMDLPARSLQVSKHLARVVNAATQIQTTSSSTLVSAQRPLASAAVAASPQGRRTAAKLSSSPGSTIRGGLDTLHDLLEQGFLTESEFEDRMAMAGSQSGSGAAHNSPTADSLPEQARSQLAQLDMMMEQGLLTPEETDERKALVMAEYGVLQQAPTPAPATSASAGVAAAASDEQQRKIEKLKEMYNAGYITEEKFMQRIEEIRRSPAGGGVSPPPQRGSSAVAAVAAAPASSALLVDKNAQDLAMLTQLFTEGFMSVAEFNHRRAQVNARTSAPSTQDTMAKVQEIQRLQQMVSMGMLSQAEFEILCKQKFASQ
mmetsp:Transcript_8953/g.27715  ORF Transcript_8953/g.27715 Transcript_8953/m.27715 type:complete len:473 (+) Transcript_8953:143-1561(+)|eukprot:CAMPEP_0177667418 /NCGR_PEP_ID=MMETSP0447-20121125/22112_1 /TAXON_ID=0 /ORGANISM="Stygamoeba regulata, Strain BSH-02190019" /LENGTH=472 /DNA_ID=CAMNT_0019173647 /DNA_START=59 /DNA_END=1477 /DNA_ORIENTATION=+